VPSIEENRAWAHSDWTERGDQWSLRWGSTANMWFGTILPRIHACLPADHILEIAPGHGRCTQFLLRQCRRLSIVDLVPECIEACRRRFADEPHVEYHVNDGLTLPGIADASVDFAFSWDSLVHVEEDVMASYARELARVLKPGALGFVHHSNLGDVLLRGRRPANEHWRARSMTAARFRQQCEAVGLRCIAQELIPWGGEAPIDALSFFERPLPGSQPSPTRVVTHDQYEAETANIARIGAHYSFAARPRPHRVGERWLRHPLVARLIRALQQRL
jgi:2-polyprenyl-3-methyl-5-hydroxy-6-metoxy-1,4-benzoquinol methylase